MKFTKSTKFPLVLIAPLVVIGSFGVWFFQHSCSSAKDVRNVILISIDTCRADYLSCYGYPLEITPNIDDLAEEGILFSEAYSPVPLTLPAHSSMLTGTIPPYHSVHTNSDKLDQSNLTLAEIMYSNGYTKAAIISAFVLNSKFGLNQGFDFYNERFEKNATLASNQRKGKRNYRSFILNERKCEETSRLAIDWLHEHKSERFFLFLHYFDPHAPYEPPEPFSSKFRDDPYAGEVAYTDQCIGEVIRQLKDLGLYESSLIIITSDHGEMLGEHREINHGYFIYQSAIKVPLIFKFPGCFKAKRINNPVGLIDIVPTVCRMLGIEVPDQVQGEDLTGYFRKKRRSSRDRHLFCESMVPTKYDANSLLGVVTDQYKYIQTTRPELYDIIEDPRETTNLINHRPQLARILQDRLRQILEKSIRVDASNSKVVLTQEDRKRLESLGYTANASVSEDFRFDQSKEDPKDLIDHHSAIAHNSLGIDMASQGKVGEAINHYLEALRINPDFVDAHNNLGIALANQGRAAEAVNHFSKALKIDPDSWEIHNNLGAALFFQGKIDEAIVHFQESLRIKPDFADAADKLKMAQQKRKIDAATVKIEQQ